MNSKDVNQQIKDEIAKLKVKIAENAIRICKLKRMIKQTEEEMEIDQDRVLMLQGAFKKDGE